VRVQVLPRQPVSPLRGICGRCGLYVLLPVLDGSKHYWVGADEVTKLVRRGEGWLGAHPERNLLSGREPVGFEPIGVGAGPRPLARNARYTDRCAEG
jgi:hypothetical protein